MQTPADVMMGRYQVKKTPGGVNSDWHLAVEDAMSQIDNKDYKTQKPWTAGQWRNYLKGIPAPKIREFLGVAKQAKIPGKMFNYLIKAYRANNK